MAKWREVVRYNVLDLTNPRDAAFIKPGFYWMIPLDGKQAPEGLPENHRFQLYGPFETREEAREDALRWIDAVLSAPDTPDMKEAA